MQILPSEIMGLQQMALLKKCLKGIQMSDAQPADQDVLKMSFCISPLGPVNQNLIPLIHHFPWCASPLPASRCAEELLLGVYDEYEDYCSQNDLDGRLGRQSDTDRKKIWLKKNVLITKV